jgi:glycosyltransferase involved in cell wall biosynthesis
MSKLLVTDTKIMISILIPFRGSIFELERCLDSIFESEFKFEILVGVDGGRECLTGLKDRFLHCRNIQFTFFPQKPGIALILNSLAAMSEGEYIARMDADDYVINGRFEYQIEFLKTHPDVDMIAGQAKLATTSCVTSNRVGALKCSDFLFSNPIIHPTVMFRRVGSQKNDNILDFKYNIKFRKSQDYELWTRIVKKWSIHSIDRALIVYTPKSDLRYFLQQHYFFTRAMLKNYFAHFYNKKCNCSGLEITRALPNVIQRLLIYPLKVAVKMTFKSA